MTARTNTTPGVPVGAPVGRGTHTPVRAAPRWPA